MNVRDTIRKVMVDNVRNDIDVVSKGVASDVHRDVFKVAFVAVFNVVDAVVHVSVRSQNERTQ